MARKRERNAGWEDAHDGSPVIDLLTLESRPPGDDAQSSPSVSAGSVVEPLGVCCSGGGIRSAAFNLGALQVLDRRGILRRARYLSAVSGGSYIASAYALTNRYSDPDLLAQEPAYAPGSVEERWLRNRCSYLAYGVAGKARLVSSVLVGVLANVVVVGLVLFTLMRPLGWFYARWQESLQMPANCGTVRQQSCYRTAELANTGVWLAIVGVLVAVALVLALAARMFYPPWRQRRLCNWLAVAALCVAAVVATLTIIFPGLLVLTRNVLGSRHALEPVSLGAEAVSSETKSGNTLALGSMVGLVAVFGAAASQLFVQLRGVFAVGRTAAAGARWFTKLGLGARKVVVYVVGGLIGPLALLAVSLLIANEGATRRWPNRSEVLVWALLGVVTLVVLRYADVTSSSMHPFYKRRLSSAFAVARKKDPDGKPVASEIPYETVLSLSNLRDAGKEGVPPFPELVVCAAANVTDPGATPPGSAVVSFVFSHTAISIEPGDGNPANSMDTATYEDRVGKRRRMDVTVPAAVAMSGAAISPSMGKMTKAPLRFLFALSNVRLGVWLPNPRNLPIGHDGGTDGERTLVDRIAPANPRPQLLLREVLGLHRLSSRYIYVTDGGHYENLGLLELVRRRCRTIVCLDAAGGSPTTFTTLGEAIALVRAELNVEIEINPTVIRPAKGKLASTSFAVGTIRYPDHSTGTLVYVKSAVTETGAWDVLAFAEKDKVFPSHPTASQLYTGERFEAYRALGAAAAEQACKVLEVVPPASPADPGNAESEPAPADA